MELMLKIIRLVAVKSIAMSLILCVCFFRLKSHVRYLAVIHLAWLCWMEERFPAHHSQSSVREKGIFFPDNLKQSIILFLPENNLIKLQPHRAVSPILYHWFHISGCSALLLSLSSFQSHCWEIYLLSDADKKKHQWRK